MKGNVRAKMGMRTREGRSAGWGTCRIRCWAWGQKEGEKQEGVQRRIRESKREKSRGLSPHLTHLREAVMSSPRQAAGASRATHWLRQRGPDRGQGFEGGLWFGQLTVSS